MGWVVGIEDLGGGMRGKWVVEGVDGEGWLDGDGEGG